MTYYLKNTLKDLEMPITDWERVFEKYEIKGVSCPFSHKQVKKYLND